MNWALDGYSYYGVTSTAYHYRLFISQLILVWTASGKIMKKLN
ncbi:hypothetical protein [Bacillus thuringiensis]|nr:hypothetical protein [Bacillus thuringiensis]